MEFDRHKLFVGGISRETSEEALRQHFSRYGVVLGAAVAREKATGNPRCFGFVRFADSSSVHKALRDTHFILGRTVDVKKAVPKHEQHKSQQQHAQQYGSELHQNSGLHEEPSNGIHRTKKVFVGGLSSSITEEEFKDYFQRFGRITDVVVMHDSVTNRPRGFGFVTYDSEDSVENVMQNSFHELSNKRVEVKRAIPKEGIQTSNGSQNPRSAVVSLPTYNSFQATPYAPGRTGYGTFIRYAPAVGYNGFQGFHYPMDIYGYGYPFIPQGTAIPWNSPIMPSAGLFCPPHNDASDYLVYTNGFGLPGMSPAGYNTVVWPIADAKSNQVNNGVEQVSAGVITPQLEGLKLEVASQADDRMKGGSTRRNQRGNAGKPLHIDTCR